MFFNKNPRRKFEYNVAVAYQIDNPNYTLEQDIDSLEWTEIPRIRVYWCDGGDELVVDRATTALMNINRSRSHGEKGAVVAAKLMRRKKGKENTAKTVAQFRVHDGSNPRSATDYALFDEHSALALEVDWTFFCKDAKRARGALEKTIQPKKPVSMEGSAAFVSGDIEPAQL